MFSAATESARDGSAIGAVFANPSLGARKLDASEGMVLFEPDAAPDNLYYIQSGQVRLYQIAADRSTRLTDILGPGDWFGIAALARSSACGTRAVIVSPSVLWELSAELLLGLIGQQPGIAVELIGQLASRLEAAHEMAARLVFDDCSQRLIQTLVRFSRSAAATPQDDGGVILRITHQQLAQAVGAARETVSLALTQLRHRNLLRTGRNRLFFNPGALEQFSSRGIDRVQAAPIA